MTTSFAGLSQPLVYTLALGCAGVGLRFLFVELYSNPGERWRAAGSGIVCAVLAWGFTGDAGFAYIWTSAVVVVAAMLGDDLLQGLAVLGKAIKTDPLDAWYRAWSGVRSKIGRKKG